MKLNEILTESDVLNEAPMGMLKRAGLGLASKFSSKAAGKLASGKEANELKKDFDFYLGSTNQEATGQTLLQYLNSEGLPTNKARELIAKVPGGSRNPNIALPKSVVDQIMSSIASGQNMPQQSQPSGTQQPAPAGGNATAPSATQGSLRTQRAPVAAPANPAQTKPAAPAASFKQLKPLLDKLTDRDKQELIDHLKKNDPYQKLKF